MAHIDLVALQQRLAQQQPKPTTEVAAEHPSWSMRPASAMRATPSPKVRPAAASAVAPGTLRATTTMRAALPLKATSARAECAQERARADALRAQIDELNAALVVATAKADRALAEVRQRADQLKEQVQALSAEVIRSEKQALVAVGRAERAEADRDAEHGRAEVLRAVIDELKAEQALTTEVRARELAVARHDALAAQQSAAELRHAKAEWRGRGRWTRLRAAWRGE